MRTADYVKSGGKIDCVTITNNIITIEIKAEKTESKKLNKINMRWMTSASSALKTIEKIKIFNAFIFLKICTFKKHARRWDFIEKQCEFLWISTNINEFKQKTFCAFFQIYMAWRKLACVFLLLFKKQTHIILHIKNWWLKNPTFNTHECFDEK